MRLSKGTLSKALTGVLLLTLLAAACAPMGGDINGRTVTARKFRVFNGGSIFDSTVDITVYGMYTEGGSAASAGAATVAICYITD